jgi:hypothetical protein
MWNIFQNLKMMKILTMFKNSIRRSMGLSKLKKHGMNALGIFLVENVFRIGKVDSALFNRKMGKDLFICQIHVDDTIFCSSNASFCEEFSKSMTNWFEMSMMGELKYFLGFQIKQLEDGMFISQTKHTHDDEEEEEGDEDDDDE